MNDTHAKTLWEAILLHHKAPTRDNNWHHYGAQMVETYLNDKMAKQEKEINGDEMDFLASMVKEKK